MKNLYLTIFLLLLFINGRSQNLRVVDSLHAVINNSPPDSSRALCFAELCFQYRFSGPDSALKYGQMAISLSRNIRYLKGEARGLSNTAFVLRDIGNLPDALAFQLKALQISEENHFYIEAGLSMIRLAAIYRDLGYYEKALQYLRGSFKQHELAGNNRGKAIATMNLGQTYLELNLLDSALSFEKQAIVLVDRFNPYDLYPNIYRIMGEVYKKLNNIDSALLYFRLGISAAKKLELGDYRTISGIYYDVAQLHREKGMSDSAVYYASLALENAESISGIRGIIDASLLLSDIYKTNDIKKSYDYFTKAMNAKDSLYSRDNFLALQSLTFEKEERDRSIEMERKNFQDRLRLYSLIAGLGIILIIALILYRNNRQKQKVNHRLENTLSDLQATQAQLIQSEKMASLGELTAGIAHEIQNPLNFVNNFSEVNRELITEMKEEMDRGNVEGAKIIAADLDKNLDRIHQHGQRADAIVKGMLQHANTNSGNTGPTDLNTLAEEWLRLAYQNFIAKNPDFYAEIKTSIDADVGRPVLVAQDISRVLINLFNNAFYTLSEKKKLEADFKPMLILSTKKQHRKILITVKDNGSGIPEKILDKVFQPFFTTKPTGQGTGLGLSLSYDIIKAHGGEIKVTSVEGHGSEFTISLNAAA